MKWVLKIFLEKEHLTKGTKILRIKSQLKAVKGIMIKHCKYIQEFEAHFQARPHCHLLNKNDPSLGLVNPECFLNIHSGKCGHSLPCAQGSLATGEVAPSVSYQHLFLWHPPTSGNLKILDGNLAPVDTDSFVP